jgi:tetrapyrrole methylase family protein / MazG family protein
MPEQEQGRPYPDGVAAAFEIARRLRSPDGCPWDREQTHESLRPYLLEETYELLEAIDRDLDDGSFVEELGDVLFQVAMHAAIAEEKGRFDAGQVSESAAAKMVARHPHVFGDTVINSAEEVLRNWEHNKAREMPKVGQDHDTVLDRVPPHLPALAWTANMQRRAARVGFDLATRDSARAELLEKAGAATQAREGEEAFLAIGQLLMAAVELARILKVNAEDSLRAAGQKYRDHFALMDGAVRAGAISYRDLTGEQKAALWAEAQDKFEGERIDAGGSQTA